MDEHRLLARLADLCGIGSEYHDIWSRPHRTEDATRRALLEAMGLAVGTVDELRTELARREQRDWQRVLPAVLVVREPFDRVQIVLTAPESVHGDRWVASLVCEDGSRTSAEFDPGQLPGGERREVDGVVRIRRLLTLDGHPEPGYHELRVGPAGGEQHGPMRLIVAPERCHVPDGLTDGGRVWGPAVQLYALRSEHNWGIGDFTDLTTLATTCGEVGAGIVGVNPLHALFPGNPLHASPYSPSTRSFLNAIYLDLEAVARDQACREALERIDAPEFRARLVGLRESELVDYAGVAAVKGEILELLYGHFRREHLAKDSNLAREFHSFRGERGAALEAYGTFEALQEHFRRELPEAWGWPVWPEPYRSPESEEVVRFAGAQRERVEFHQYVQWLCDRQLAGVGRECFALGLTVGLYQDLAVSVDRAGFETWRYADVYAKDAGMGAPPDDFNLQGQDWGLPPMIPERLREVAYEPFIECLRANMRHAGALRIDHVMGLMRAFWVPPGLTAADGAYVHYPFEDLLAILVLESRRNRCLVIGEDLGTVPDEVRAALEPAGVLSYRLFFFMKTAADEFAPPADYPEQALVAVTTHDLPTLAGFWRGRDIALRHELGMFPEERPREQQLIGRSDDRTRLLFALRREGLLPEGVQVDLADFPDMTAELVVAIHRYIARSPCSVLTFQLEDVLGQQEQVNLPGTTDQHPNWCRKLTANLEDLRHDEQLGRVAEGLRAERGEGRFTEPGQIPPEPFRRRIPLATYRLQLNAGFRFEDATSIVPYLRRLGISHVYTSPFLKARPGSLHGYDIIDHDSLNPEIGTREEFEAFVRTLREHEMGLVVDIVPNHMGVGSDNAWWMSVLEHGRASPYAGFFDIDWRPQKEELRGKVLLPVLEDQFGAVLEAGLLRLRYVAETGEFRIAYHDHRFPLDPRSYRSILLGGLERLESRLGADHPLGMELASLGTAFGNIPDRDDPDRARVRARLRDAAVHKARLARLAAEHPEIGSFVAESVALVNGTPGNPESFDGLEALLAQQAYWPAFWRVAADEINYRRFFDINELAGVRMEQPEAFEAAHAFVARLVQDGKIDGLRIDHPDGLHDPAEYYRRLRRRIDGAEQAADDAATWLVVEKILASHERIPDDWPVHGTTGYDFCNLVGALFVDPASDKKLDAVYSRFVTRRIDFDTTVLRSKRLILDTALAGELSVLANDLERISEADRRTRDFTRERLRRALAEVIAYFPVYRTYVSQQRVTDQDRRYVDWAVRRAKADERVGDTSIYDFIRDVLLLDAGTAGDEAYRREILEFVQKFQQITGPVMAKGLEDTAFYIYNRLLSLNEVGGEPRRRGVSVGSFHRANLERVESHPAAMLCSSTHDSKRSEDVRARISVLSELPDEWEQAVRGWAITNRNHRGLVDKRPAPSRNDEYALYQTLVGAWPFGDVDDAGLAELRERVGGAMIKAAREAKVHTSWINQDEQYEAALTGFVDAILGGTVDNPFLDDFLPFQRKVSRIGALNGLAQLLLKLTAPGVPDIYQGSEVQHFALVDPDNRRPVDFERRRRMLDALERLAAAEGDDLAMRVAELLSAPDDGRAKLYVTWRALGLRRELETVFRDGSYDALRTHGSRADHLCAFARRSGDDVVYIVAPRLIGSLTRDDPARLPVGRDVWGDTRIELTEPHPTTLHNHLTGERLAVTSAGTLDAATLFAHFPLALLGDVSRTAQSGTASRHSP